MAIVLNGDTAFAHAVGLAHVAYRVPVCENTRFSLCSLSKQFTAMAVMVLIDDGELELSDDIRQFVPELPDYGHRITIDHLLRHTSGIRDFGDLLVLSGKGSNDSSDSSAVLSLLARQRSLNAEPGSEVWYSSSGYFILGLIVERLTGRPLSRILHERVFAPLGMRHTLAKRHRDELVENVAIGHYLSDGELMVTSAWNEYLGCSSVYSTVQDMVLWDRNWTANTIGLSDPSILMRSVTPGSLSSGRAVNYGCGLHLVQYRGLPMMYHRGIAFGCDHMYCRFPTAGVTFVTFSNASWWNIGSLTHRLVDVLFGGDSVEHDDVYVRQVEERSPRTPYVSAMKEYLGRYYTDELGVSYSVETRDGALFLACGQDGEYLSHVGGDRFVGKKGILCFNRTGSGTVGAMTIGTRFIRGLECGRIDIGGGHPQ